MTTEEFITRFRTSNPRDLALQASRYPGVDMPYALDQIQGWQTARQKLPSWAVADGVVFPPHLNMEQCSSEPTALYKQDVARHWLDRCQAEAGHLPHRRLMTDLTGGFGVDFSFMSRCFDEATYVERNAALCDVVRANLPRLGVDNASVVCGEAEAQLAAMEPQTMVFLDPARRDTNGARTVFISDCTPDVCSLLPQLMAKSMCVMLKLSPMLDWHKAVSDLHGTVREVHIVSVGGECKELLLVLSELPEYGGMRVVCVDISTRADACGRYARSEFAYTSSGESGIVHSQTCCAMQPSVCGKEAIPSYLYEPNASVMKAGCFGELSRAFGVVAVSPNSHLFLSDDRVEGFPGRTFAVETVTTMNKRELRQALSGIDKANIAVRNFPMSVAELRKRLKLKDGGDIYIFATTTGSNEHVLVVGRKV